MIPHWILRRIKRRHNAIWVDVRWQEPFGDGTWAVWANIHCAPKHDKHHQLGRSRSLVAALWQAWWCAP